MNIRKLLPLIMTVLLIAMLFAGCGAASMEMATDSAGSGATNGAMPEIGVEYSEPGALADATQSPETVTPQNQKLIRKVWLDAETEDMDTLLSGVEERIAALGGYVENREVHNGSQYAGYTHRYASLTIRIPADKLDSFVEHVSGAANITSTNETADDITLTYVATESRMKTLETEQARLLELLAQAKNMEEILQIEERLTDVRGELEEVTSRLRVYDNLVSYGTVYLNLDEVREYTVVEEEPDGFFERIGKGFMKSLNNLGIFLRELVIFVIVAIPYLIPVGIIAVVIIVLVKVRKKRKAKKQTQEKPPFPTEPENE